VDAISFLRLKLMRLLRSRGCSSDDTDDLIQEAFLRLQLYCQERTVEHSEAFLVRTVLNLSVDARRLARNRTTSAVPVELHPLVDSRPPPDEVLAAQQSLQRVRQALDALSPRVRDVFLMHRAEGYSYRQIADHLGIAVSTVEKHMAKAALFFDAWSSQERRDDA
jgi:RNA polymerase sigma-70 factor (ECF subfamily)